MTKLDALPTPRLNLYWEGTVSAYGSIPRTNRELCRRLAAWESVDLTVLPYEVGRAGPEDADSVLLDSLDIRRKRLNLQRLRDLPSVCVRHRWPVQSQAPPHHLAWVIFQPWEYSVLTVESREIFKRAEAIWTTSGFCRESFVRSGLDADRVWVIPLGVDGAVYRPDGDSFSLPTGRHFRFIFVGGTIYRKGVDVLLRAYGEAFGPTDDVTLIIKDFGTDSLYRGQTTGDTIREFQRDPGRPDLVYIDADLTEVELASLYRSCRVFVSSYRGEGFAMPVLEAMACGLPVIVTAQGPTDDFCSSDVGWRIDSEWRSVGHQIYGKETVAEAFLLEPSVGHLGQLMRSCYESQPEVAQKGRAAHFRAAQWSWDRSVERVGSLLEQLTGVMLR
ncbi:MAG: glycosyltransferase [Acidobacteriota bacterium]